MAIAFFDRTLHCMFNQYSYTHELAVAHSLHRAPCGCRAGGSRLGCACSSLRRCIGFTGRCRKAGSRPDLARELSEWARWYKARGQHCTVSAYEAMPPLAQQLRLALSPASSECLVGGCGRGLRQPAATGRSVAGAQRPSERRLTSARRQPLWSRRSSPLRRPKRPPQRWLGQSHRGARDRSSSRFCRAAVAGGMTSAAARQALFDRGPARSQSWLGASALPAPRLRGAIT